MEMIVLDHGAIRLIDSMGDDQSVVAAARVSNGVIEETSRGEVSDGKLINYLMKHRHGTPFEHVVFTFHIKCPIFVAREWMRHRIGSYNEISGRYVEFKPDFYTPDRWRVPAKTNKQGSVVDADWKFDLDAHSMYNLAMDSAFTAYQGLLDTGVAREMARMVLPLSLYTEFYWTVNARALMNFLSLRSAEDAQYEIRVYANEIMELFKLSAPLTYWAWVENKYLAP